MKSDLYGGLWRVIRFVPAARFPVATMVSTLDPKKNLLRVNREIYERLAPGDQRRILSTDSLYVEVRTTDLDAA